MHCLLSSIKQRHTNLKLKPFKIIFPKSVICYNFKYYLKMAAVLNYTTVPFTSINIKTSVKQSKSQIVVLLYTVLKSPKPTQNSGVLCLTFLYPKEFSQLSLKQFLFSWLLILKLNLCSTQRSSP